ncbi:EAL domain-containing protein [Alkalibacillus aidingensis]|uniref:EAL domain-containing protein n=1 Tax=Alkalibacillus aidingensis TaxID=2747607 RepID=UPI001660D91D|nr:EAL domain-containing protein [Alkalibacillus aidingensis]
MKPLKKQLSKGIKTSRLIFALLLFTYIALVLDLFFISVFVEVFNVFTRALITCILISIPFIWWFVDLRPSIQMVDSELEKTEKNEQRLQESIKTIHTVTERYRSLFEHSPNMICSTDLEGNILSVNPAMEMAMGRSREELINISYKEFVHPDDLDRTIQYNEEVKKGHSQHFEISVFHKEGHVVPVEVTLFPMKIEEEVVGIYSISKDISREKEVTQLLEKTQQKFNSIYQNTLDAIIEINHKGQYTHVNEVAEMITGYRKEELTQLGIKELIAPQDVDQALEAFNHVLSGEAQRVEVSMIRKDGEQASVYVNAIPVYEEDGEVNVISFIQDITEKRRAENEIRELAYKDSLTKLPNRSLFSIKLNEAMNRAKENKESLAVLFIDFDNFKTVNDTLGHEFGDEILKTLVEMMKESLRKEDVLSRQGGDEFLILVEGVNEHAINQICERIIDKFSQPIELKGHEVFITPSIGICVYPEYDVNSSTLIKNADIAMYLAKERGRNNYQYYTDALNDRIIRNNQILKALRKALDKQEFSLHYQPQYDVVTNELKGVEALLRWNPEFGFVSPAEFIPIAEETGLIVDIGEWVLKEACHQAQQWRQSGFEPIPISVNVSARQFMEPKFIQTVSDILSETGLPANQLMIEITERVMLDIEEAAELIRQLRANGVRVAIDDFGIGYSSLSMIRSVEIDCLKIDQSFLYDVMKSEKSAILLEAIMQMGFEIGSRVVVEGIETKEQVDFLLDKPVIGQGYYYSRPLPVAEMEFKLKDSQTKK